jgi:hypothetical protein
LSVTTLNDWPIRNDFGSFKTKNLLEAR